MSNILPKKRWHVLRPENVARVLRDQQEYAAVEAAEERRQQTIRHERRVDKLRNQ